MLFVGLDIGGTNIKAGILDWDTGELVGSPEQEQLPKHPKDRSPEVRCKRGTCCTSLPVDVLYNNGGQFWEMSTFNLLFVQTQHAQIINNARSGLQLLELDLCTALLYEFAGVRVFVGEIIRVSPAPVMTEFTAAPLLFRMRVALPRCPHVVHENLGS